MSHIDEVRELAFREKPLIIMLSETCVTKDIDESEISIEGYVCYNVQSHSRFTGSCVAYVSVNLNSNLVLDLVV